MTLRTDRTRSPRQTWTAALAILTSVLLLTGCTRNGPAPHPPDESNSQAAPVPTHTSTPTVSSVQHVVIIMDENKPAAEVLGNPAAPYLNGLAHTYAVATDYSAITHPSLPNYLAITGGTTFGINSD